ncbi:MAG: hypothetical protein A2504_00790 [Bdellovibrionales bacterium RIFOXYD12_FULL_39_22]|nr:MAG: hypothetical protein A2385_03410 [Bdellovibrionales bacterium RIFOXYB1_FULL_39_21]OFZ42625.1 MAG: hypothetical protein A2485_09895 [Bdellovibrionales bacterium RIFOXYC12_FULL_39_17]OFZ47107.1 MAG: hypothetical protein A2404_15400 [Bdellovibrionales bacterium RIFOXYC1_FULL_39_130]OFZ68621.1 MAG: hypothetical protein A2451_16590 [Bdellovibrionales bacterium RIFOXYC2_FULL_39_8]OFZ75355.1 MAG: hypothetical protein A2560_14175 [Bdellovibrionales bacterium RIFOXYD1_FULL_39_84]OFZ93306.1 MAG:
MFGLGAGEILLIAVIALLFIGPQKLPEIAKQLGKAVREFKNAKQDFIKEINNVRPTLTSTVKTETETEKEKEILTKTDQNSQRS